MKFRVEVNTYGDGPGRWSGNAVTYEDSEAAVVAAKDLFFRWTAVNFWRVVDEGGAVIDSNEEVAA